MEENKTEEKTLWDDLDTSLLRAKQICRDIELPLSEDPEEIALAKIVLAINALCDKIEKPKIITLT